MDEGIAGEHGAEEPPIEVLRRVRGVPARCVLQQRHGMDQAVVQGQPEEQWLERGTRRPRGAHAVHLAGDIDIEEVPRSHQRKHLHAPVIDQQGGGILDAVLAAPVDMVADAVLKQPL